MAGSSNAFNAARFRSAIRSVMTMGTPPVSGDQLRFYWNPTRSATATKDGEGIPFDPSAPVATTTHAPVSLPCAIEYIDAAGQPTPFGAIAPSKVRVTLLDEDYDQVKDADYVLISGDRYIRHHEPPSYGLFTVGVHQIIYTAENET